MIQAHVCLKRIVIIREIEPRIAWSVADVKIYVEKPEAILAGKM